MRVPPPQPQRSTAARPRNPGTITTGLVGWWRADQGVYQDTGGTTPATNGSVVARWNDLSGNGRHATQATGVNQPTYTADAISGYPGIYVGASTWLATASVAAVANTDLTMMAVYDRPANTANLHVVNCVITADPPPLQAILIAVWSPGTPATAGYAGRNSSGSGVTAYADAGPGGNVAIGRLAALTTVRTNLGATRTASVSGANHTNSTNTNICPAGRSDSPTTGQGINCLESAIWSRQLTDAEVASLIAYAKARYGL